MIHKISENGKQALIPLAELVVNNPKKASGFISSLKTDGTNLFYNAPLLVIILGNKKSLTANWDCAMAALMDERILKELGASSDYKAVAPLIFGYPRRKTVMPRRTEPEVKWLRYN